MADTQLQITLPTDMAEAVARKVGTRAIPDVSAFVLDSVRNALDRDETDETLWSEPDAVAAYDEWSSNPSEVLTADQVRASLGYGKE